MAAHDIVDTYEMLYGIRTGLTVLLAPVKALDVPVSTRVEFSIDGGDLLVRAGTQSMVLKAVPAHHIEQATRHGAMMFYEMDGDDVVRCTPCYLSGA